MKGFFHVVAVLAFVMFSGSACSRISVPSLEDPSCTSARDDARSFYSLHFDSDLKPTTESIELRSKGLTKRFADTLRAKTPGAEDPFTLTEDYPRAFKLGGCEVGKDGSVSLEVQVFWRDKDSSRQESVNAIMIKQDGHWLIDDIVRAK